MECKIGIIGRCGLNTAAIMKEMPEIIYDELYGETKEQKNIWQKHYESVYCAIKSKEETGIYRSAYEKTFKDYLWPIRELEKETAISEIRSEFQPALEKELEAAKALHVSFKCYLHAEDICIVSLSGEKGSFWLFPARFVTLQKYRDYGDVTGAQRAALAGSTAERAVPAVYEKDGLAYNEALALKDRADARIKAITSSMDDVKDAKAEELKDLQTQIEQLTAEMEARKEELMQKLQQQKQAAEEELEKMERMVFLLDAEIYSIRCFTGEVAEINQLRAGKPAAAQTPIVLYQKIRYMDEELGRIASINNIDFSKAKYFEEVLSKDDAVLNRFIPAARGVALIRVSRTDKNYFNSDFPNLLETYQKYHGSRIALLIRDGENLYLSWTDDDRINFPEDAFLREGETELSGADAAMIRQGSLETDREYEKRMKRDSEARMKEMLGRYYVFALLQGMLDRNIIVLPEKVVITESRYIIFSYADAWLDNNKYGTLSDMIGKCNSSIKKGDSILLMQSLFPRRERYGCSRYDGGTWDNIRGRGERNRTHDVHADDNTIYKVNLTEHFAK